MSKKIRLTKLIIIKKNPIPTIHINAKQISKLTYLSWLLLNCFLSSFETHHPLPTLTAAQ